MNDNCANQDFPADAVRCPVCGGQVAFFDGKLACTLGHSAEKTRYGWSWGQWEAPRGAARWKMLLKSAFDPLANPYSPLVQLSRKRVECYYARALDDRNLAKQWRAHFLGGLELPAMPTLLDHGCGRGRLVALARQCGFRVFGQEIMPHPWWGKLEGVGFQVAPPMVPYLPWADDVVDVVTDFSVINHFAPEELDGLASEVLRVLRPGGYWIIWEVNSCAMGTRANFRHYGRLHALEAVRESTQGAGFEVHSSWFEGMSFPVFPRMGYFLHKFAYSREFDYFDYGHGFASRLAPEQRAMWVLRLKKPG